MKPAPFDYYAPVDVAEALELLEQYGDDAKVLAGGQSLMPLMNLRLARPKVIVDINRLSELAYVSANARGGLTIGALTRQRAIERSAIVTAQNPLLAAAIPMIGHFQIRNRGTIGGSVAHADPAAELPAVCLLAGAEFSLRGKAAVRTVTAEQFFLGYLATARRPDELLSEIHFPRWPQEEGWAIEEISRRKGDFAMIGVALRVRVNGADIIESAGIVMFGVGGRAERLERAEAVLKGRKADPQVARELSQVVAADLNPDSDIHASAEYRKEVGGVLTRRALESALIRARQKGRS